MPKSPRPWIVTRHDPIEKIEENLWAVNGDVPGFPPAARFYRRMHIVRLADGRLLFNNAVPVDDATLAEIKSFGTPSLLLVPHHLHAMDAHAFREKLGLEAYTSAKVIDKVRAILPVAGPLESLPTDETVSMVPLESSKFGEVALTVKSGPRVSLLVNDVLLNLRRGGGFSGLLFHLMGFTGPAPKVAPLTRRRAFPDKEALRRDLNRLAEIPGLTRVVPCHGLVIAEGAAAELRRVAATV
jgi:hypothetical protein